MKFSTSAALFSLFGAVAAHDAHAHSPRHLLPRQSSPVVAAAASSTSTTTTAAAAAPASTTGTAVPPLSEITSGMATESTLPLTSTYAAGATAPISGAPALPTQFVFNAADWPTPDVIPPTNSPQVAQWLTELNGYDIPDIEPTVDGTCANDPAAAADAAARGWWTCGGYTRSTDIVSCPTKYNWGLSFDDGPSLYTPTLLDYLGSKDLKATFFVVGSRVVDNPETLVNEYMDGHEISVHTWSHHYLTAMTNEQIVAELGWTREAIKTVLGVTPTTMRPPYGDIDDRVRAISLAMGLVPVIWTSTPSGGKFDTNDWRVAGGQMTGEQQLQTFEQLLTNASLLNTGFIVLEHDLFEITVDLARGYTINAALTANPPFNLTPIGYCQGWPAANLYRETTTNTTFPYPANGTAASGGPTSTGTSGAQATGTPYKSGSESSTTKSGALPALSAGAPSALLAAALLALSASL